MPKKYNYDFLAGLLDTYGGEKVMDLDFQLQAPILLNFALRYSKKWG